MDELAAVQASAMTDLPYLATSGVMLTGENFQGNGFSVPLERTGSSDPLSDTDKSKGMFCIAVRMLGLGYDSSCIEFSASNL